MSARFLFAAALFAGPAGPASADPKPASATDVVYGRRDGLALTMDVTVPEKSNKAGVIVCISGDFKSTEQIRTVARFAIVPLLTKRGYTVFAVMHGSQPRFTVPEIVEDMHRAVRFIKSRAGEYGVDPERLGIAGASSGGHLSLMMGCAYKDADPEGADELERKYSSKVAAVACFFPVTDFLEFDKPDLPAKWEAFRPLFDVREPNALTSRPARITAERRTELGRLCSPLHCAAATRRAAPTFIIHGSKDELIPLHQSQKLEKRLTQCGAVCKLGVEDIGHDIGQARQYLPQLIDWFDLQLLGKKK